MHNIEAGWYSLRVVAINAQGETQIFNSWKKYTADNEQLKENKREYLSYLISTTRVTNPKITHVVPEKAPSNADYYYGY
jgi:hypothetical protein